MRQQALVSSKAGCKLEKFEIKSFFHAVLRSPLFVTWNKASRGGGGHNLRGCIGTLEPRQLHKAVKDYALTR